MSEPPMFEQWDAEHVFSEVGTRASSPQMRTFSPNEIVPIPTYGCSHSLSGRARSLALLYAISSVRTVEPR